MLSEKSDDLSSFISPEALVERLLLAEKKALIGRMTTSIAHDVNNLINFVYAGSFALKDDIGMMREVLELSDSLSEAGDLEELREKVGELKEEIEYEDLNESINDMLDGLNEGAERTASIVKTLRNVAHSSAEFRIISPHEIIRNTFILCKTKLKNLTVLKEEFDEELFETFASDEDLNFIFLTVFLNAGDALSKPSDVVVKSEQFEENGRKMLRFTVSDEGKGMDAAVRERLFEPYFTTKDPSEHNGTGLWIARLAARRHGGDLLVRPRESGGTEVIFTMKNNLPENGN